MSPSPDSHEPRPWLKARVSAWFWSLTPTCREVARLTSEGRDHPLPLGMRLRLGLHRGFCQWCARYAEQLDLLHEASQLYPKHIEHLKGPKLDENARARMKGALQRETTGDA
jgi:hypothetical protein